MIATSSREADELAFRANVKQRIDQIGSEPFKYIDATQAEIMHLVAVGMSGWVCVIGVNGFASYEWVARRDGLRGTMFSNLGYAQAAEALRDGLNVLLDSHQYLATEPFPSASPAA